MEWEAVWRVVLCVIASAGGAGGIIVAAVKFSSSIIAERLSRKFEADMQKQLEQYKAEISEKTYVTKVQYDAEFAIYRSLTKAFFEMILALHTTFSPHYRSPENSGKNFEYELPRLDKAAHKSETAQNLLYENGAFIPKKLYDKYDSLLDSASNLFWEYSDRLSSAKGNETLFDEQWLNEKYDKAKSLHDTFISINSELREYLQGLCVIE